MTSAEYESQPLSELVQDLQNKYEFIKLGGGEDKIKKEHEKGKLTARERINYLLDEDSRFYEIGTFAGWDMYEDEGGCPSGGVITGIGYIADKMCMVVANDATVKAGAWFPVTAKKNLRAQEISIENRLPIIYLVDSAGVYLPMQDEIFPDKEHFGRQFRNNARMSAMGIPQVAVIMGSCVAGGAYLPIMCDEALIVDKTGTIFLAGSYLVKAAIGEEIDNETLGGATTHCEISGVTDYKFPDDASSLEQVKRIIGKIGSFPKAGFDRKKPALPKENQEELYDILPDTRVKPYDMHEIIKRITDESAFDEYKAGYGKTILCGYARIDGWAVGIVANQRTMVKTKKGEMQMGGVIYSDAADKAARFIMSCNQKHIPLVFFQDVTGFMVGSRSEHGGIIKDGAKMVSAMANSVVPKFTFIIGNSYGAGNYAMCGKAYDPRFIYAWPSAKIGVMSGASASKTLLQIKVSAMKKQGKQITEELENQLMEETQAKYNEQLSPYYAAARLWVDDIIDPLSTRYLISKGIEAADHNAEIPEFKTGVLQT